MTDDEMMAELTKDGDPEGQYCCPLCYTWFATYAEKDACLRDNHGYDTIELTPWCVLRVPRD
jgi:hypothetical protein